MPPGDSLLPRFSAERVSVALKDTPVVMVNGPRQCGKTTLVRSLVGDRRRYITLDDDTALAAARNDPAGFIRGIDRATIDEVQRVPELLRAIKRSVDEDRRPGRFLLTGSANVLALPQVSESLAGRMEIVSLFPLSYSEILGKEPRFLVQALAGILTAPTDGTWGTPLVEAVLRGGYPEMIRRAEATRRRAWARDYLQAIVQRDVRDVAEVEKLDVLPRLIRAAAHHAGQLVNFTQLGARIGLDDKTARKYLTVLEQLFLMRRVEPWHRNRLKRLVKTPKLHFLDAGLLAAVQGATAERIERDRAPLGPLLETFVFSEIAKLASWLDQGIALYHYRDKDQDEVDVVVEADDGSVVGIEVKAAATVTASDFKGLKKLAGACDNEFKLGVVLYDGDTVVPFGERLFAAPVACLWA